VTTHTRAWRNFKRTEDCACVFAALIYTGAVLHGWRVLPGDQTFKLVFILGAPALFLGLTALLPLVLAPLRRLLARYVWMSFRAGFGQTPFSVLSGLGLLAFAAVFVYLQISRAHSGGRYPAGVFAGYAAGIGILLAQAVLVRALERDPQLRPLIEEPAGDDARRA
jgi:hypothetical protein